MNNNVRFFVLLALVVLACGLVWYFVFSGGESAPQTDVAEESSTTETTEDEYIAPASSSYVPPTEKVRETDDGEITLPDRPEKQRMLRGPGRLYGQVTMEGGGPLPNATVRLEMRNFLPHVAQPKDNYVLTTNSDAAGNYEFKGIAADSYALTAAREGWFGVRAWNLNQKTTEARVDIECKAAGVVAGKVFDPDGNPVAGAVLFPLRQEGEAEDFPLRWATPMRTYTQEDGSFEFTCLWPPAWSLTVMADGFALLETDPIAVGTFSNQLTLSRGGTVKGRVVDADTNEGIPGVDLIIPNAKARDVHELRTAKDGVFEFKGIAAGSYYIEVRDDNMATEDVGRNFEIAEGQTLDDITITVNRGGVIEGRVYDAETEQGIPNVVVRARFANAIIDSKPTGSDGRYRITGLRSGDHWVFREAAKGYPTRGNDENQRVSVSVGEVVQDIDFALKGGLSISGRVVDERGEPVSTARVSGSVKNEDIYDNTSSHEDGTFTLVGFPAGAVVEVSASKEGFASAGNEEVTVDENGASGVELVIGPEATMEGTIIAASGDLPKNLRIIVSWQEDGQTTKSRRHEANDDGTFKVTGLSKGVYTVKAGAEGYDSTGPEATVPLAEGDHKTGVRVTYDPGPTFSISGRVMDANGRPIAKAHVGAYNRGQFEASADDQGRYEITGIPQQGEYHVNANAPGYASASSPNRISGETRNLDFTLQKTGAIEGRVISAATGKPVTPVKVMATSGISRDWDEWMQRQAAVSAKEDGSFTLENVRPGPNTVFAWSDGFARASITVEVAPDETTSNAVLRLSPGATISGVVIDPSGNPLRRADVRLRQPGAERYRSMERVRTQNDGAFEFSALPEGEYLVTAEHKDFSEKEASVYAGAGHPAQVTLQLSAGGVIEGRITSGGKPLSNASVYAQSMAGGSGKSARTDESGFYQIVGLPSGETMVTAGTQRDGSNRSQNISAVVQEGMVTEVNLDFPPGNARIAGRVTIENGQVPFERGWIVCTVESANGSKEYAHQQVDSDGNYELGPLPAGTATVNVNLNSSGGGNRSDSAQVTLQSNRTVRKDFNFEKGNAARGTVANIPEGYRAQVVALRGHVEAPEFTIEAFQTMQSLVIGHGQVQDDGSFVVENVPAGPVTILVLAHPRDIQGIDDMMNHGRLATQQITVGNQDVTVNLRL